ncbi:hypothetical protein Tco_1083946, partial [Tanacetum coccineum]
MSSTGVSATTATTIPLVTSSVALIPEHEGGEYADSVFAANVQTSRPVMLLSRSSTILIHACYINTNVAATVYRMAAGPSQPSGNDITSESFYVSLDMDSEALHQAYVPKWDVLNDSLLDDSNVCRSVVDQLAPPVFFLQLRAMEYDQLLSEFNVGAARQTCLSAKVRMRLEHLLRGKKRLEGKCGTQEKLLKERDLEIADLKTRLSLKEAEEAARACELGSLKEQSVAFESTAAAKDAKIAKLSQDLSQLQLSCDDLSIKASTLEREKDKLIDHDSVNS